jgi:hypothetical protein
VSLAQQKYFETTLTDFKTFDISVSQKCVEIFQFWITATSHEDLHTFLLPVLDGESSYGESPYRQAPRKHVEEFALMTSFPSQSAGTPPVQWSLTADNCDLIISFLKSQWSCCDGPNCPTSYATFYRAFMNRKCRRNYRANAPELLRYEVDFIFPCCFNVTGTNEITTQKFCIL